MTTQTKNQYAKIERIWNKIKQIQLDINLLRENYVDEQDARRASNLLRQWDKKCSEMLKAEDAYSIAIRSFIL